jgi:dephospho-CoA kinase
MTFRLGLTGSIGMGKSTTAAMFARQGIPVWDADATVHRLYEPGNPGAHAIAELFPAAIDAEGRVDRLALRQLLQSDPRQLERVNAAIHPLAGQDRAAFLAAHSSAPIVLLDIPLLYESGLADACDAVAVVSAPAQVQRDRVLSRGMSQDAFAMILARQLPDAEKRARADYIIETTTLAAAQSAVKNILDDIRRRMAADA